MSAHLSERGPALTGERVSGGKPGKGLLRLPLPRRLPLQVGRLRQGDGQGPRDLPMSAAMCLALGPCNA